MMKNLFMEACFTPCEPTEHIIYANTNNIDTCSEVVHFCSSNAPIRRSALTSISPESPNKYTLLYNRFNINDYPIYQLYKCVLTTQMQISSKQQTEHNDNPELINQILAIVKEKRGIHADSHDILITHGSEDAIKLIASVVGASKAVVGVSNPGHIKFANVFKSTAAQIRPVQTDLNGVVPESAGECDYLFVMPTNQYPSTMTMPLERRIALMAKANVNNTVVIEDDFESDVNFLDNPIPALKSMDTSGQVVYMGNLSDSISSSLKIGYIIANRELIKQLRTQQQLSHRQVSLYSQQVALNFITFGYYENHIRRIQSSLERKWIEMITALESGFNGVDTLASPGSFFIGIRLPNTLSSQTVIEHAEQCGVIIDPKKQIFSDNQFNDHYITLGFGALDEEQVQTAIAKLSNVIKGLISSSNNSSNISDPTH